MSIVPQLPDLDWNKAYPTARRPTLARNLVATSQPLAAQAGIRMLLAGGNAVDAALATAITLTLVEPISNGIGSDAFAIVWDGSRLHGLNASGRSPAAWTPGYFKGAIPPRGWNSVTVPGAVSAWVELSGRFGKLPFERLFEPAIDYARRGFPVSPFIARSWQAQVGELQHQPGFAQAFMPDGRAPSMGEMFRLPAAAATLEDIAHTRGESFYRGELAKRIAAHSAANGGAMTEEDLASHRPDWCATLSQAYRGLQVHELPPNGQGIVCLIALGILSHFDLSSHAADGADSVHLQIEALKLAFADAYRYVSDPEYLEFDAARLLDPAYLKSRAALIDMSRAQDFGLGTPPKGGTVYLAAVDESGMMVSMIQSNFNGFGSGVVVPGTGISLQNRGAGFSLRPGHPNEIGGGKRPFHTIIPGFLTRHGAPLAAFGVMGGPIQPPGHVQTLVRLLTYGMNPQAALDAPRWKVNAGLSVDLESSAAPELRAGLAALGHRFEAIPDSYMDFGAGQFIVRVDGGYVAASDPRRDGQAAGF